MSSTDLSPLLAPISADRPCGENLEYEGLGTLESQAIGTPEQQMGNTVVPALAADWKKITQGALELARRSHDLRIISLLTRGWLHTRGVTGLADGLTLFGETLDKYWDTVHPELDPSDGNDPTQRLNIIGGLCDPSEVLNPLRAAPIVSARGLGRFSLRDVLVALGEEPPPSSGPAADKGSVEGAFMQAELSELEAVRDAAGKSEALLTRINDLIGERTGQPALAPDFSRLSGILAKIQKVVDVRIERRQESVAQPQTEEPVANGNGHGDAGTHTQTAGNTAMRPRPVRVGSGAGLGEIRSPEDVTRALDAICGYYDAYEPSSPVPMVLRRAKRLVGMSFVDIMNDLMPDAVDKLQPYRVPEPSSES